MNSKIIGLIPARMKSSRFPGKPIANICDKPMIYWVYEQALKVKKLDEIYVVTEDEIIAKKCKEFNIPYKIEKRNTTTATERLSLVAKSMDGNIYLNIQGDEPLINPDAINQIIDEMEKSPDIYYLGLRTKIKTEEEFKRPNIVKVVVDENEYAMYFSRSAIPYTYNYENAYKVLGLYAYRSEFLKRFSGFNKSNLEDLEMGIEMLRIMEKGYRIKMIKTEYDSIGVDLPEHIALIESEIIKRKD